MMPVVVIYQDWEFQQGTETPCQLNLKRPLIHTDLSALRPLRLCTSSSVQQATAYAS